MGEKAEWQAEAQPEGAVCAHCGRAMFVLWERDGEFTCWQCSWQPQITSPDRKPRRPDGQGRLGENVPKPTPTNFAAAKDYTASAVALARNIAGELEGPDGWTGQNLETARRDVKELQSVLAALRRWLLQPGL